MPHPKKPRIVERKRFLHHPPPNRVWERTDHGLWASRPWRKDEKAQYSLANQVTEFVQVPA